MWLLYISIDTITLGLETEVCKSTNHVTAIPTSCLLMGSGCVVTGKVLFVLFSKFHGINQLCEWVLDKTLSIVCFVHMYTSDIRFIVHRISNVV